MNKEQELENVNAAFFLETRIVALSQKAEELIAAQPQEPIQPQKPKMEAPSSATISYPTISPNRERVPWQYWMAGTCLICLIVFLIFNNTVLAEILQQFDYQLLSSTSYSRYSSTSRAIGFASTLLPIFVSVILIAAAIILFRRGSKLKRARAVKEQEKLKKSSDYLARCHSIDLINQKDKEVRQQEAQKEYQKKLENYEKVIFPLYRSQVKVFKEVTLPSWKEELATLHEALSATISARDELYDLNVIPGKYRNLEALTFISAFMGTSQYDLKFAIERYDKDIDQIIARAQLDVATAQLELTREILSEVQYANYLNELLLDEAQQSNKTLKSIKNWTIANTAMHAYDILHRRNREKKEDAEREQEKANS